HEMVPGDCAGFPAGTGIAHTFLNNTNESVQLLVLGERTKKENRCAFPLNPEAKSDLDIWWENPPLHKLGPHNGLTGPVAPANFASEKPPYFTHAPSLPRKTFFYPGDNLTCGDGVRLTDHIGLKYFGISYEVLPPGHMSSFAHAHTHEEEFGYILSGTCDLWLDGHRTKLGPGDAVSFVPGTGVSHCLINDSSEDVIFIGGGETTKFENEKIIYPLHPIRNEEFRRKGFYWDDYPRAKNFGTAPGRPKKIIPGHMRLRHPASDAEVLETFEASKKYFQAINGTNPTLKTVRDEMTDGPKNGGPTWFKEFFVIEIEGQPAGVVDLHNDHPEPGITFLGLLLLREDRFGRGLGRAAFNLVEDYARRAYKAKLIRIGISRDNDVSGFWRKMGFSPIDKVFEWKGEAKTSEVHVFDKHI
ncbi:MAG: GNAT family N-acetyltransferase, partial [Bdellovibrionia bacterium]